MTNEHLPNCDCYDCLDKSVIGSYVKSKKPIIVYNKMGGTVFRTVQPGRMAGHITALNSKGNWLYVSDPYAGGDIRYIFVTPDLTFSKPTELTDEQKKEAIYSAIKSTVSASSPGGTLAVGTVEVANEAGKAVVKFLPKLKWIIIGVVLFLVLVLVVKIKS